MASLSQTVLDRITSDFQNIMSSKRDPMGWDHSTLESDVSGTDTFLDTDIEVASGHEAELSADGAAATLQHRRLMFWLTCQQRWFDELDSGRTLGGTSKNFVRDRWFDEVSAARDASSWSPSNVSSDISSTDVWLRDTVEDQSGIVPENHVNHLSSTGDNEPLQSQRLLLWLTCRERWNENP